MHRLQGISALAVLLAGCSVLSGCSGKDVPPMVDRMASEIPRFAGSGPFVVTDGAGLQLALQGPAKRIVSLSPGGTELLYAAGAGGRIVATVQYADFPEAARSLPRVGDANALDYERLVALQPDVIVVWENLTNRIAVESLHKLQLPVYFIRARTLSDIPATVRALGTLAGTSEPAETAAVELDRKVAALVRRPVPAQPLRVFYMIWAEPLYTVGSRHIITDAIELCGGRNIFDDIDFPAPIVEIEAIVKRDPELMILSVPPITARDWRERWAQFTSIRAVATNQMPRFEDPALDRMGPTAIDAVESLCKVIDGARAAHSLATASP